MHLLVVFLKYDNLVVDKNKSIHQYLDFKETYENLLYF